MDDVAFSSELRELADARIAAGQHRMAMLARELVYRTSPGLLDRVDFEDDAIFLEPLLFACLTLPRDALAIGPEQVLAAQLSDADRAAGLDVFADATGRVEVPGVGTLVGAPPGARLRLSWRDGRPALALDGAPLPCGLVKPLRIPGGPELARVPHPLLAPLFHDHAYAIDLDLQAGSTYAAHLHTACARLASLCPDLYRHLMAVTRRLIVFRLDNHNSFADLRAHGAAFINAALGDDDVFLVEDLAHQCGHVAFSALTFERTDFLAVSAATRLPRVDAVPAEDRTVYTALHGVFTEAWMVRSLGAWLARDPPSPGTRRRHELEGRLAFILRRFGSDLANLAHGELFTPLGGWLLAELSGVFAAAYDRWSWLALGAELSNQPYNFSYAHYARANPIAGSR